MCGISGVFHYGQPGFSVDVPVLEAMTRCLAHRGPDGEGFHVESQLGLGHRRLSIVDLSPTGTQPMATEDGSCWITYNGEFYNHETFRARLTDKGYRFRGTSDTETLLNLYHRYGTSFLADTVGIFAFAIWDRRIRRLVLARDPLGVKPLYCHDDGRRIRFASEIKALLVAPDVPRALDPQALNEYLHFHTPIHDRTFFQGIRQLRPGEVVEVGETGPASRIYWHLTPEEPPRSAHEAIGALRDRLASVVRDQLMSDVPVGAFFSGGIDSSAVAAFANLAGKPPRCFGVHFTGQAVIDERPYQESAAKALGVDLELTTLDGSTFPDDLSRLIRQQDEPIIGPAMFPMDKVARLAARRVKVCLGGQGADEIFGGYARYALMQPWTVLGTMLRGHESDSTGRGVGRVGGNLWRQLRDPAVLRRLLQVMRGNFGWRDRYFATMAQVPEGSWRAVLNPGLVDREACRGLFLDQVLSVSAVSPAEAAMKWDLKTYLPGLFHQDDRMSMAHGLESRVPMADPRLVRLAFSFGNSLRFRAGATKWALRKAVADILPEEILNRRKVGFDTPIKHWMTDLHSGFVRETLLSAHARSGGILEPKGIEAILNRPTAPNRVDILWKLLCVETWARELLRAPAHAPRATTRVRRPRKPVVDAVQELRELGLGGALFRVGWETKMRSGLLSLLDGPSLPPAAATESLERPRSGPVFADPLDMSVAMRGQMTTDSRERLRQQATSAREGRIRAFGRWEADFGSPIDWHLNPVSRQRWNPKLHWTRVQKDEIRVGDIKLTWEVGRFPHAYALARAACYSPEDAEANAAAFANQVSSFVSENPCPKGVHWASGQEIAIRLVAWQFGIDVFSRLRAFPSQWISDVSRHAHVAASHIARHLDYSRKSVYNNHVLGEALGLYLASRLAPPSAEANSWRTLGLKVMADQASRQVYRDGAYIQNSHNYHRVAVQYLLVAVACARADRGEPAPEWLAAIRRSLDFLFAHQNECDGRLPNYGANDGALPLVLTNCDFADFRPLLQAASVAVNGERIYDPGPWDECAAWLFGPSAMDLPIRRRSATSVSFGESGYHVLRAGDTRTFATLRCGSLRERFSQMDMLHVDYWWKGQNLLLDAGSYLYNGPARWHEHFLSTESHNTVTIDGLDQMLLYRRFKCIYLTRAKLLAFERGPAWALVSGEHYGFMRHPGEAIHRRSVLLLQEGPLIVIDSLYGRGSHSARLHWLCSPTARYEAAVGAVAFSEEPGEVHLQVRDADGQVIPGSMTVGADWPPRGWDARYYAEKRPVSSVSFTQSTRLPAVFVTCVAPRGVQLQRDKRGWVLQGGLAGVAFDIADGFFNNLLPC